MISYSKQSIDEDDIEAVSRVLKSDWLTQGPEVERFERLFADFCEAEHAVAFSSGTAALEAAYFATGVASHGRVLTSPITFAATVSAGVNVGAKMSLVDIDSSSFNIDWGKVPKRAKAVVPVHFAGRPSLIPDHQETNDRIVIEDAAHALGARTPAGPVGNCADSQVTCFSLHAVKGITAGEGGVATTNDFRLAKKMALYRSHGIERDPERPWRYDITNLGRNYRITDFAASLAASQLRKLPDFIERRNQIAEYYRTELARLPLVLPLEDDPKTTNAYHLFPVQVENRDEVISRLRRGGIGAQVHYIPIHYLSAFRRLGHKKLQNSESFFRKAISIPLHPSMSSGDQKRVVLELEKALQESD